MKYLLFALLLSACGNVGQQCNEDATCIIGGSPALPSPTAAAGTGEIKSAVNSERTLTALYRCHATTFGARESKYNAVAFTYELRAYSDLTASVSASVNTINVGSRDFTPGAPEARQGLIRIPVGLGYWEIWMDKGPLVLSAYYHDATDTVIHNQSWLACTQEGV